MSKNQRKTTKKLVKDIKVNLEEKKRHNMIMKDTKTFQ